MFKNIIRIRNFGVLLNNTLPQLTSHSLRTLKISNPLNTAKPEDSTDESAAIKHTNPFSRSNPKSDDEFLDDPQKNTNPFAKKTIPNLSKEGSETSLQSQTIDADEKAKRLKVLQLEVDIAHQEGRRVPQLSFFQDHHWQQVLALPSRSARTKYYAYLWQIEMKKESKERKKSEKAEENLERIEVMRKEREENNHIIYGLAHTSMFLRIYDSTINHWQNNRLTRAMQFSPKMVLDCSYDGHMTKREAINASKQLMLCFAENRAHDDPFDLHYCNANFKGVCMQSLKRYIPTMMNPEFPMNVHSKCFTELFPKENLVYLTPHCRNDLETYNPDDVYIVGAMVDTINNEPLSLAKAKKLGLRMARLPLDRYLQWGSGSGKSLTLNQMVKIMLDLKFTGDWQESLKHVPRRKIINLQDEQMQQRRTLTDRAGKLNMRIDHLLDVDQNNEKYTERKVRSHKEKLQFDLNTWGSNKKKNKFRD